VRRTARCGQAANQAVEQTTYFGDFFQSGGSIAQQCQPAYDQVLSLQFGKRTSGDVQVLNEFGAAATGGTFGDVAGYRHCSAPQLAYQAEALISGQQSSAGVDFARERNRFMPDNQVFVTHDLVHDAYGFSGPFGYRIARKSRQSPNYSLPFTNR